MNEQQAVRMYMDSLIETVQRDYPIELEMIHQYGHWGADDGRVMVCEKTVDCVHWADAIGFLATVWDAT